MKIQVPSKVPADIAEIGSGFVLTNIDEVEAALHMHIDDVKITEIELYQNYLLQIEELQVSVDVYRLEYYIHFGDDIRVYLPTSVRVKDGWLINEADIPYLLFLDVGNGRFACIGCLTKQEIDEMFDGCMKKAVLNTLQTF